jgi:hypothetical protein
LWFWYSNELAGIENKKQKEEYAYFQAVKILQKRVDSKGKAFGLFKASSIISITCSKLLEDNTDLDYIVVINTWDGFQKISVRAREGSNFNVTDLKYCDGHVLAGGGQLPTEDYAIAFYNGFIVSLPYKDEDDSELVKAYSE